MNSLYGDSIFESNVAARNMLNYITWKSLLNDDDDKEDKKESKNNKKDKPDNESK